MQIKVCNDRQVIVQSETFHTGEELARKDPLLNAAVLIFTLTLCVLMLRGSCLDGLVDLPICHDIDGINRIQQGCLIIILGISGFYLVKFKPKSPERKSCQQYVFDLEIGAVYDAANAEKIYGKLEEIKNIQLLFSAEQSHDDEIGTITSARSRYAVELDFGDKRQSLELECNSCNLQR
jgi:hypothetical protein